MPASQPEGPRPPRITGTHFYTWVHCRHAVAQDMVRDRSERRPLLEHERFARERGLRLEADVVERLGAVRPEFPRGDFAAGAKATLALMAEGHPWIEQAVLYAPAEAADGSTGLGAPEQVGMPDLLRKVPGPEGDPGFHYEPVDVKSSADPRSDQILQVAFYGQMLAKAQGVVPERGALILKDGRLEDFALADYVPAATAVRAGLQGLWASAHGADKPSGSPPTRPRRIPYCGRCHWSHLCLQELEARDDLSLVQGMTPGVQDALEAAGIRTAAVLAEAAVPALTKATRLEAPLLRRLRKAAQARCDGKVLRQRRPPQPQPPVALVHLLTDPFADRVLAFGTRRLADGAMAIRLPEDGEDEWRVFRELMAALPRSGGILHHGGALPRWLELAGWNRVDRREAIPGGEQRLVDLARRLRGAVLFPGPVFGLDDQVRLGLGQDPDRAGAGAAAAWWVASDAEGAGDRLRAKLAADLEDLEALHGMLVADGVAKSAAPSAVTSGSREQRLPAAKRTGAQQGASEMGARGAD